MVSNFQLKIETASGFTEVTQSAPETLVDRLNRLAKECGYNNIGTGAIQIYRDAERPNGVTMLYNRNTYDSFTLNPVRAAVISEYRSVGRHAIPPEVTGPIAMHRINVSYSALTRMNTVVDMQRIMGPLINEAIKDFIDEVGFIGVGYTITAEYPGTNGQYFRDLEEAAGMEFRLLLNKGN